MFTQATVAFFTVLYLRLLLRPSGFAKRLHKELEGCVGAIRSQSVIGSVYDENSCYVDSIMHLILQRGWGCIVVDRVKSGVSAGIDEWTPFALCILNHVYGCTSVPFKWHLCDTLGLHRVSENDPCEVLNYVSSYLKWDIMEYSHHTCYIDDADETVKDNEVKCSGNYLTVQCPDERNCVLYGPDSLVTSKLHNQVDVEIDGVSVSRSVEFYTELDRNDTLFFNIARVRPDGSFNRVHIDALDEYMSFEFVGCVCWVGGAVKNSTFGHYYTIYREQGKWNTYDDLTGITRGLDGSEIRERIAKTGVLYMYSKIKS